MHLKKTSKSIIFLMSFLLLIGGTHATMPKKQEFEKDIQESLLFQNEFFKNHPHYQGTNNSPLSPDEQQMIESAPSYLGSFGPKIIRPLKEFKGKILLIGGERKKGEADLGTNSVAEVKGIEEISKLINEIDEVKFNTYTGEKIETEQQRQALKKSYEEDIKKKMQYSLDTYYVSNIAEDVIADLIASAIDKKDMAAIPDGYFQEVEYESVNCQVFLFKDTWDIMERITKPGGQIRVRTAALTCMRLIPTVIKGTKWEKQVNEQIQENYQSFANQNRPFILNLQN